MAQHTAHSHREVVPGCFPCDLSSTETQQAREARYREANGSVVAVMALADEERAAVVAELEQARAEVERINSARDRWVARHNLAVLGAEAAEAREVAPATKDYGTFRDGVQAAIDLACPLPCGGCDEGDCSWCLYVEGLAEVAGSATYFEPTPPAAPHAEDGADCNCGYGGFHEELNYRCDKAVAEGTAHPAPVADPSGTGGTR